MHCWPAAVAADVLIRFFPIAEEGHSKVVRFAASETVRCSRRHKVIKDSSELFLVIEDAFTELDPVLGFTHLMYVAIEVAQHLGLFHQR